MPCLAVSCPVLMFSVFFTDDFTEELLGLHDSEVVLLRQHYDGHKELFEGVHKWEESWRLFLDLEVCCGVLFCVLCAKLFIYL